MIDTNPGSSCEENRRAPISAPGEIMPDFSLVSTDGKRIRISDYHGRRHLILIFIGLGNSEMARELLRQLADRYSELASEDAQVLMIVQRGKGESKNLGQGPGLSFPVLIDDDSRIHNMMGALKPEELRAPIVCIVDRYGEIRHEFHVESSRVVYAADTILDWVRYINLECPE
jgi:peroxiredoxin